MQSHSRFIAAAGVVLVCAFATMVEFAPRDADAARYVETNDPAFPRVKYADSLVSPNDRCMVAQRKLSLTIRPIYVNGSPMGFC